MCLYLCQPSVSPGSTDWGRQLRDHWDGAEWISTNRTHHGHLLFEPLDKQTRLCTIFHQVPSLRINKVSLYVTEKAATLCFHFIFTKAALKVWSCLLFVILFFVCFSFFNCSFLLLFYIHGEMSHRTVLYPVHNDFSSVRLNEELLSQRAALISLHVKSK